MLFFASERVQLQHQLRKGNDVISWRYLAHRTFQHLFTRFQASVVRDVGVQANDLRCEKDAWSQVEEVARLQVQGLKCNSTNAQIRPMGDW